MKSYPGDFHPSSLFHRHLPPGLGSVSRLCRSLAGVGTLDAGVACVCCSTTHVGGGATSLVSDTHDCAGAPLDAGDEGECVDEAAHTVSSTH